MTFRDVFLTLFLTLYVDICLEMDPMAVSCKRYETQEWRSRVRPTFIESLEQSPFGTKVIRKLGSI